MTRDRTFCLLAIMFWLCLHPRHARAQLFLSPQLETNLGYTSNRYFDAEEEGSSVATTTPSLQLTWFGPQSIEITSTFRYAHTEYLRSSFGRQEEWSAAFEMYRPGPKGELILDLAVGSYRDSEIEDDDSTWVHAAPTLMIPLGEEWSASAAMSVNYTRYATRTTSSGEDQWDTFAQLRPGLTWRKQDNLTIWGELIAEGTLSNEDSGEFVGGGFATGVDTLVWEVIRTGAWLQWTARDYSDASESRSDHPLSAGLWSSWRIMPWAEATLTLSWSDQDSNNEESDYQTWAAFAGLRLVYDWEVIP